MTKRFEYREPEFTVVMTAQQDVLTASGEGGILPTASNAWDTITPGGGVGFSL